MQTLTVHVPDSVFHSLKAMASESNRSVEVELVEQAATAVLSATDSTFWQEAWRLLNQRRAALIRKKNHDGLSIAEQEEYEKLQGVCLEALEAAFPGPPVDTERLDRIEARLQGNCTELLDA